MARGGGNGPESERKMTGPSSEKEAKVVECSRPREARSLESPKPRMGQVPDDEGNEGNDVIKIMSGSLALSENTEGPDIQRRADDQRGQHALNDDNS
eukprot:3695497-Pyramimonas_sp.AAC.1